MGPTDQELIDEEMTELDPAEILRRTEDGFFLKPPWKEGRQFGAYEQGGDGLIDLNAPEGYERMNKALQNSEVAPILKLPSEILVRIFTYVLGGRTLFLYKIRENAHRYVRLLNRWLPRLSCMSFSSSLRFSLYDDCTRDVQRFQGLWRVCRRFCTVSILLPYSQNTFTFQDDTAMQTFLACRVPIQKNAIRYIQPSPDFLYRYTNLHEPAFFRSFANLRVLHVTNDIIPFEYRTPEKLFKDRYDMFAKLFLKREKGHRIELRYTEYHAEQMSHKLHEAIKWYLENKYANERGD